MPSQDYNGLKLLIKEGPVDDAMWRQLLETRVALIKPYLENFFLQRVGHLDILASGGGGASSAHTLEADLPSITANLKTQGLFFLNLVTADRNTGLMRLVGLSRSAKWLQVSITLEVLSP